MNITKNILIVFFSCATCLLMAQNSQVKVKLRNGIVIKGDLKEFNPTEYVIVRVAGIDSKILLEDVESVENSDTTGTGPNAEDIKKKQFDTKKIGAYEITDYADYPESFELEIYGKKIKMLLVRGGIFNMGYDGDGSLSMKSEPMHQVSLTSFYISENCINEEIAFILLGKEGKKCKKDRDYSGTWKAANQIVENIAKSSQKPYRLLTEAEWEYASLMPDPEKIWGYTKNIEWCSDFFGEYDFNPQNNPKGPISGRQHVYRSFRMGKNKWDRKPGPKGFVYKDASFRIAICADRIK